MKQNRLMRQLTQTACLSSNAKRLMVYWLLGFPVGSVVSLRLCSPSSYHRAKRELFAAGIDITETQANATKETTANAALLTSLIAAGWMAGKP